MIILMYPKHLDEFQALSISYFHHHHYHKSNIHGRAYNPKEDSKKNTGNSSLKWWLHTMNWEPWHMCIYCIETGSGAFLPTWRTHSFNEHWLSANSVPSVYKMMKTWLWTKQLPYENGDCFTVTSWLQEIDTVMRTKRRCCPGNQ